MTPAAGALVSVMNGIVDALSELGIRHIDMPTTPERVWRAIQETKIAKAARHGNEPPSFASTGHGIPLDRATLVG